MENPCIYYSPNGLVFNELNKWKNPLAETPYKDHNSDADIHIDQNNKIKIIYLESLRPELNKVIELTEVDTGFVKKELIIHDLLNNDPFILSPAFVRKNEKELLYFVNMTQKKVEYINLTQKTKINEININLPNNYSPWHVDILSYNNKLYLLTNGYYGNQQDGKYNLLISESTDGVTWNNTREILNENQVIDKELKYIYRSTFIMNEEYIVLWYSYVRKNDTWRVALKKIKR